MKESANLLRNLQLGVPAGLLHSIYKRLAENQDTYVETATYHLTGGIGRDMQVNCKSEFKNPYPFHMTVFEECVGVAGVLNIED